jgi:nucleotide-binding universal stress UspA family protein
MEPELFFGDDPAAEIVGVAEQSKADLIVMGTHGRTGLGRFLMGSVAEQVVRRAPCPVVTVRTPLRETHSGTQDTPGTTGQVAEVMCG